MTPVLATITVPALLLFASVAAAESTGPLRGPGQSPTVQSTAATAENDTVAVTIFSNISGATEDEWVGAGIVETLTADFERLAGVSVVGGQAGAGARWVISGAYQRLDERMRITARVVEVATDAVVHTAIVDGSVAELFALQDQLSAELSRGLTAGTSATSTAAPTTTTGNAPVNTALTPSSPPAVERPSAAPPPVSAAGTADPTLIINSPAPPLAPATIARDALRRATLRAVPLTDPLEMDGVLDEDVYETVPSFGDFIQQIPLEGEPSTERTEAWVFYDSEHVYVAGRLWDSAPEAQWIVNEMRRDSPNLFQNEYFSAVFDTFYDRRNAVGFMVNPIGGFSDIEIVDERPSSMDWNPVWNVRTGRFDGGWTVEMQIPFKSIRFRPGQTQLWGLQLGRHIRWKNERAYLTPVPISGGPGEMWVSAGSTLTGIEVPEGNRTFEIKPYGIGSMATDVTAVPRVVNQGAGNGGVDVKFGITENLTADFTYNTDFAQVEVDQQQVNLTRFSLFFPEKREFFLESQGTFDFGRGASFGTFSGGGSTGRRSGGGGFSGGGDKPTIFFSRRIGLEQGQAVPILGGGRLTGKVGNFSIGAVNIQTDNAPNAGAATTNFTVLRVKRDILRRSAIGAIFTGRSVSTVGPGSNEVYGLDGTFAFYDNVNLNGYYARTRTPGLEGDDESYQAAFTYNGDRYALGVDHLLVGDNFNPEIGFLRRDDFRRTFVQAQFSPRPASIDAVRQFTWGGSLEYILNGAGQLESRVAQTSFGTEFENSDRFSVDLQRRYELLVDPFDISSDVSIPVGSYGFQDYYASYSMGAQRKISGTFSLQRGEFFDGDITAIGYSRGRIEITPQMSIEPSISVNRIALPGGRFTTKLATTRFTYTFTPRMFFSGLLQYNSSRDVLSTNLRLRWEYQPGSELFVVYNDQRDTGLGRSFPMLDNRAFIVKFTRLFRF